VKVLHVIKHSGRANGNVNSAVDLACAQAKAGLHVTFASSGGDLETVLVQHGVRIVRTIDTRRSPFRAIHSQLILLAAVLRLRPNIIHAHMVSSNLLCQIPRRVSSAKLVSTVHNAFEPNAWLMGWADRVIAVSAANARDLIKRGISPERVSVVRNAPIGSARLPPQVPDIGVSKPAIVTVCGLHSRKRVEDILDAAAIVLQTFAHAHFYIVGEGPDLLKLQEKSKALDISESVHFVGYQADPLAWMKAADIFVLASQAEPFCLVLGEARSQGCAIIATNVDGNPEVLENGKAGILVPSLSPEHLAREINMLLSSEEKLQEFKLKAKTGIDWLVVDHMERGVHDVYSDALCANPSKESSQTLSTGAK
jgi:glycosyltransferase involved in cell wall biosynthesis